VIGAGRTGHACAEVLSRRGAHVFVTDEGVPAKLESAIASTQAAGAQFVAPDQLEGLLPNLDRAILSPGVPLRGALAQRVAHAVPLVSEIEVAYEMCDAPIIAVTGTKGKSTTTALIAHILRSAGKQVRVGGNIGNPLIREAEAAKRGEWVVAEISSFQLEAVRTFKPRVAVVLNVSEDHLDRYSSVDDYAAAKYRIFENQGGGDTFIGNRDDARVSEVAPLVHGTQWWFSAKGECAAILTADDDAIWYRPGEAPAQRVVDRSEIPLPGAHNLENVLAAVLAALAAGVKRADIQAGLSTFQPMAHRLQTIAQIDGIRYVDDSKATNPAAVIAALGAFDAPIILIAGGRSKGAGFSELGSVVARRVKALVAIGEAADAIAHASVGTEIVRAATLVDAVRAARERARPGDVVLLSPGCASFDMFESAEARGEAFAAAVNAAPARGIGATAGA